MSANPYKNAYKSATTQVDQLSSREIEGRALVEASKRLMKAYENPDKRDLADDALDFNWQLWTIFQAEADNIDSPLPDDMRINILELCRFIDKSVIRFFSNRQDNMHLLKLFADMNQNIASGLFKKIEDA